MEKQQRHRLIARLVASGAVRSQESLRDLLGEQGVRATQGTLSRDLRELGVVKGPAGYTMPNSTPVRGHLELGETLARAMKSIDVAGSLVVLHTEPGNAGALAVQLDAAPPTGVVGTIAGDDTIFIATRSAREAASVLRTLSRLGGFK